MEVLSTPRGDGKTTKLITILLEEPNSVMIVSTTQRKEVTRPIVQMVMQRKDLLHVVRDDQNRPIPQESPGQRIEKVMERIITCDELRRLRGGRTLQRKKVMVDDLEDVLWFFLGEPVVLATTTIR